MAANAEQRDRFRLSLTCLDAAAQGVRMVDELVAVFGLIDKARGRSWECGFGCVSPGNGPAEGSERGDHDDLRRWRTAVDALVDDTAPASDADEVSPSHTSPDGSVSIGTFRGCLTR